MSPFETKLSGWVGWMRANRPKLLCYGHGLQIVTGLILLSVGWWMGHVHFHLLCNGTRTQGRIIDYKQEHLRRDSSSSFGDLMYVPVVEFESGHRVVRFEDWLGSSTSSTPNQFVPILYDPKNLSVAMIDRKVMNWIPWAPISAAGFLLLLAGIKGIFRWISQPRK